MFASRSLCVPTPASIMVFMFASVTARSQAHNIYVAHSTTMKPCTGGEYESVDIPIGDSMIRTSILRKAAHGALAHNLQRPVQAVPAVVDVPGPSQKSSRLTSRVTQGSDSRLALPRCRQETWLPAGLEALLAAWPPACQKETLLSPTRWPGSAAAWPPAPVALHVSGFACLPENGSPPKPGRTRRRRDPAR